MRVRAALYYPNAGVIPETITYRSTGEMLDDFFCMKETAERFGSVMPEGVVYPMDSDEPTYRLSIGPQGGINKERC